MSQGAESTAQDFFSTLRGSVIASIPAVTALVFVIVSVKVFRVSGMEATTTVAIVSSADVFTLLKGVILTMLPGFLTAVTAVAMWWWADSLPQGSEGTVDVRGALRSPQAFFAWVMVTVAFFTISWPIFLALVIPVGYVTVLLVRQSHYDERARSRARVALKGVGGVVAALALGILALAPMVWLPLRTITVVPGEVVHANGKPLPDEFAAYVLNRDDSGTTLLLAEPRTVISVGPGTVEDTMPLCVTPEAPTRVFYLRPSQIVHLDPDNHSPYPNCPQLDYQTIFGT